MTIKMLALVLNLHQFGFVLKSDLNQLLQNPVNYRVIDPGDGGGGDGSSGSEESGNDGGVSTIPLPTTCVQTTYDALRGLGIVGSHAVGEDEDQDQPGHRRSSLPRHAEVTG